MTHAADLPGELAALVHRADLDALVRAVDGLTAARDWPTLLALRDACRAAVATGRQLWPAATLAEYRLALRGPSAWAAQVLDDASGRFTIGPLTEVVAQTHSFAELAAHVADEHRRGFVAHERALRGEAIPWDTPNPLDIPFSRAWWEPEYLTATYTDDGVDAPAPALPPRPDAGEHHAARQGAERAPRAELLDDVDVTLAVRQLFDGWTADSTGRVEVSCVEGDAAAAVHSLGAREATLVPVTIHQAVAWLAWAGASGGAHGRRRGLATGRFGAWWVVAAIADLDLDELVGTGTPGLAGLRWFWWDAGEPHLGWNVQLGVHDPAQGCSWALSAHDAV